MLERAPSYNCFCATVWE